MKKLLLCALLAVMALCVVACDKTPAGNDTTVADTTVETPTEEATMVKMASLLRIFPDLLKVLQTVPVLDMHSFVTLTVADFFGTLLIFHALRAEILLMILLKSIQSLQITVKILHRESRL